MDPVVLAPVKSRSKIRLSDYLCFLYIVFQFCLRIDYIDKKREVYIKIVSALVIPESFCHITYAHSVGQPAQSDMEATMFIARLSMLRYLED